MIARLLLHAPFVRITRSGVRRLGGHGGMQARRFFLWGGLDQAGTLKAFSVSRAAHVLQHKARRSFFASVTRWLSACAAVTNLLVG